MAGHGIRSASDSARSRLREALHGMSARLTEKRRVYKGFDATVFTLYAIECFLQALASTPRGSDFVLKGGNLFRVWQGLDSFRPTGDLDMQCSDDVREFRDVADLRAEVGRVVCTDEFREATGLVFEMDGFRLDPIRKGSLVAYRLDGKVTLGEPHASAGRPAEIPFCLEVTYGRPPEGAVELSRWESIMPRAGGFDLPSSRPEWMAAEKFHSVVTRGAANTRLKDFRDLMVLLSSDTFDDTLMLSCVRQVFAELDQTHLVPVDATGLLSLSAAFATPHNDFLWKNRRWPEWEGRKWSEGQDPDLAQAMARILVSLERRGILAPCAATGVVSALSDLCGTARGIDDDGPTPLLSARFATGMKTLVARAAEADTGDVAWRWRGEADRVMLPDSDPAGAVSWCMGIARDMGLLPALDMGWNRGRGGGEAAIADLIDRLSIRPRSRPIVVEERASANQSTVGSSPVTQTAPRTARRAKAATLAPDLDATMASGVLLLREGRPGTHIWFGGLAKVISSVGAAVPATEGLEIEVPADTRAPFIWVQIAKRQRIEENLARAVETAREILALDVPAAAPVKAA